MWRFIVVIILFISCTEDFKETIIPQENLYKTSPSSFMERFYCLYKSEKETIYPKDYLSFRDSLKLFGNISYRELSLRDTLMNFNKYDSLNIEYMTNFRNPSYKNSSPFSIFDQIVSSYDYGVFISNSVDLEQFDTLLMDYNGFEKCLVKVLKGEFDSSEKYLGNLKKDERIYILLNYSKERLKKYGYSSHRDLAKEFETRDISRVDLYYLFAIKFMRDRKFVNYTKAYQLFDIYSSFYNKSDIYNFMAFCRMQNGYEKESVDLSRKSVILDSLDWRNYFQYGSNLYHLDKDKAIDIFNKAIALGDSLDSHLYLGKIYYEKGDFEKAIFHYRERMRHSYGNQYYRRQAAKGIRKCLEQLKNDKD
ncbi:MAG: hypothetical protein CR982_03600 [Candidatus Cloacimonadota bacterium]|nr:MAG: hypothetical protein CR982_03600 [Candidatus Cloacimonadota bacterium]